MAFVDRDDQLWQVIGDIVADEGLALYDLELCSSASLKIYVHRISGEGNGEAEQQGGVTSGDCSRIVRRLMVFFEAEGDRYGVHAEPEIEVSSPGINRVLRLAEHFQGAVGERVKIVENEHNGSDGQPVRGRSVVGDLRAADGEMLVVIDEATKDDISVAVGDIKRARVDFQF